jgi:carboxyl-terminal processing protease
MDGGRIAYIHLSRFGDTSNRDWDNAVTDILSAGPVKGLIFDLRNNPGGYLDGAVYIASEFVKSGTIVSQVNSDGTRQDYPVNRRGRLFSIPVVVLINKGSASAAEITAGALRDLKRAKIVGETSFGKGTVQTPEDLSDGSSVHITTGKWLLPNGDSIAQKGITPDVTVAWDGLEASQDAQLAKAVELLLK